MPNDFIVIEVRHWTEDVYGSTHIDETQRFFAYVKRESPLHKRLKRDHGRLLDITARADNADRANAAMLVHEAVYQLIGDHGHYRLFEVLMENHDPYTELVTDISYPALRQVMQRKAALEPWVGDVIRGWANKAALKNLTHPLTLAAIERLGTLDEWTKAKIATAFRQTDALLKAANDYLTDDVEFLRLTLGAIGAGVGVKEYRKTMEESVMPSFIDGKFLVDLAHAACTGQEWAQKALKPPVNQA